MNEATFPIAIALSIQFLLGVIVFQSNWHRKANQAFLLLSAITAGWLGCLYFAVTTTNMRIGEIAIREASVFAALTLIALNFLRVALTKQHLRWREITGLNIPWLIMGAVVTVFCQTRFFVRESSCRLRQESCCHSTGRYGTLCFAWFFAAGASR